MFDNIIGNNKIKDILAKSIQQQKTSHSYLFIGTEGIGKKLIAKEFAKRILCLNHDENCCNCKSCIEFETNNNPDFMMVEPDGNSIKIEQVRLFQKNIQEKPIISNRKAYIIDNADKMTIEAQNCLLKTLEEPPEFGTIILIGSNENLFLSTIKSRCMIFHFENIKNDDLKIYLKNSYGMNDINDTLISFFQGSIGKAILLKDKIDKYEQIEKVISNLENNDIIDVINMSEIIYKSKEEIFEILEYINVILLKDAKNNYKYLKCIDIVEDTKKRLQQNANFDMCIDNMLFNIWEEVN